MEGKNQVGSSASSLTSVLFGSKDDQSPSSSSGIFGSVFDPPSKVSGIDIIGTEDGDDIKENNENGNKSTPNKDISSIFQGESVEPCHFSSSIYYGGQEVYHPQKTENAGLNPLNKKDGGEDDSGSASRGNWWQGSLYY